MLIAIMRLGETHFVHYDLTTHEFSNPYQMEDENAYSDKTHAQIIFARYYPKHASSVEIRSVTIRNDETGEPEVLHKLPLERLQTMILSVYNQLKDSLVISDGEKPH